MGDKAQVFPQVADTQSPMNKWFQGVRYGLDTIFSSRKVSFNGIIGIQVAFKMSLAAAHTTSHDWPPLHMPVKSQPRSKRGLERSITSVISPKPYVSLTDADAKKFVTLLSDYAWWSYQKLVILRSWQSMGWATFEEVTDNWDTARELGNSWKKSFKKRILSLDTLDFFVKGHKYLEDSQEISNLDEAIELSEDHFHEGIKHVGEAVKLLGKWNLRNTATLMKNLEAVKKVMQEDKKSVQVQRRLAEEQSIKRGTIAQAATEDDLTPPWRR